MFLTAQQFTQPQQARLVRFWKRLPFLALILACWVLADVAEASRYEPPLGKGLIGYPVVTTFKPRITASIAGKDIDGAILLKISLAAQEATHMKLSADKRWQIPWQPYTPQVTNWRVRPQTGPITLYAIFKRPQNLLSTNTAPPATAKKASVVSPIVHYTLDLNRSAHVLERYAYGYANWTTHTLTIEQTYPINEGNIVTTLPQPLGATRQKNTYTQQNALFQLKHLEHQAQAALNLTALEGLQTIRITPAFTLADLLYLDQASPAALLPYRNLLVLQTISYKNSSIDKKTRDNPPVPTPLYRATQEILPATSPPLDLASPSPFADQPKNITLRATLSLLDPLSLTQRAVGARQNFPAIYQNFRPQYAQPTGYTNLSLGTTLAEEKIPFSTTAYTALVLDLRNLSYLPNLYPRVMTESGQIVLAGRNYTGNSSHRTAPQAAFLHKSPPYVRYVRDLTGIDLPKQTLFVSASSIRYPLQDIVISDFYGKLILANRKNSLSIENGAFFIVTSE